MLQTTKLDTKCKHRNFDSTLGSPVCSIEQDGGFAAIPQNFTPDNIKDIESKERAFALNYVSDPVIQYDKDIRIIWANKAALVLSGFTLKQISGKSCCEVCLGIECDTKQCPVRATFQSCRQGTKEIQTQDGRIFSITSLPFLNSTGNVECVIEIIRDNTAAQIVDNLYVDDFSNVQTFAKNLSTLTAREYEVMSWVVGGKSNKNISQGLQISPKTVEIHRARVMTKLDVDSLADLVRSFTLLQFYKNCMPSLFKN